MHVHVHESRPIVDVDVNEDVHVHSMGLPRLERLAQDHDARSPSTCVG